MKYLLQLLTVGLLAAVVHGVKWNDFRGGNSKLPLTQKAAEAAGWLLCDQDDTHNVKWFSKNNDLSFSVGYDENGDSAGVRVIISESSIDSDYLKLYKQSEGIFEQVEYLGEKAYRSTVLFTPKGYVTKYGQDKKDPDEVAYFAYLKEGSKLKMLSRKLCDQAQASYTEQGCHSNYGLVLSKFESEVKCKYLKPFYTIYDLDGSGDLIGFGWITFSTVSSTESIIKPLTTDAAKSLFPKSPDCLTSGPTLAVAEVWLSYKEGQQTSCPATSWIDTHCEKPSGAQAQEEVEESVWSKLFG